MYAKELIGKRAVRTAPANGDNSYRTTPIKIVKATETHIVYKYDGMSGIFASLGDKVNLLNSDWNDNNWIDYDELVNLEQTVSDIAESIIAEESEL